MTKQEKIKETVKRFFTQAYINGYNAKGRGEVWEQEDGSVELPDILITLDTLSLLNHLDSQGAVLNVEMPATVCDKCKGDGTILFVYDRPLSPPGNMLVECGECKGTGKRDGWTAVEPLVEK